MSEDDIRQVVLKGHKTRNLFSNCLRTSSLPEVISSKQAMSLAKAVSCDHLTMAENSAKQVRWSVDLEEICYFTPRKHSKKSIAERIRELKDKANDLADRTFRPNVHHINSKSRRDLTFRKGYSIDFATSDFNQRWDDLFEIYRAKSFDYLEQQK